MPSTKSVWYIAAGYKLPAGIEGYLLNYATEIRNHGFSPRIIVFEPLPVEKHRCLQALEDRQIPIDSLHSLVRTRSMLRFLVSCVPWFLVSLIRGRKMAFQDYRKWIFNKCMVNKLESMIRTEKPDIIHVKGRLVNAAWWIFPSENTIYHHALSGTVDPSWEPYEVEEFRKFANRIARVFAPGENVARVFSREFGITRKIDAIFTMAPDECECKGEISRRGAESAEKKGGLRFGILCRFTEQKGIKYILEALKMFKDKYGDVDFTFAGSGELEGMIRNFIAENGLSNVRVRDVPAPYEVLKDIDVFVHPGLDDAMPVSIVEALMCSCPCIATNIGGVPDLVRDGREGFLIDPEDAEQIFQSMSKFWNMEKEEFNAFIKRARNRYEDKCIPEIVGRTLAEHYRTILESCEQR